MSLRSPVILALALVQALAGLNGQSPLRVARATQPAFAATDEFAGISEFGGALVGVARSYRVTFGDRGIVFQPALGRHAPQAASWRATFTAARRGERELLRTAAAAPVRSHDRRHVEYAWPGIVERYEARADGLEQSFVFAHRPAGSGDLVVQLRIETALPAAADAFRWCNARGGGVELGAVTGIDAGGRRCAGTMRHIDAGVELSLPAAFVDAATYPLVLDPLIGTATEAYAGLDCDFPDVAYDAYTQSYCVVWTQFLGGGQTGVVGSVFTATPLGLAYAFAVNQNGDEDSIRVCNIAGTGLFAMFWVNRSGNQSSISGLAFEPTQAQATQVFQVSAPGQVEQPVVSGEATLLDDDCLLAWLDGTYGLIGCSVAIDQQLQVSATPIVQVAGNATEPAFSKQGGTTGLHLLTWVDRPLGSPGWIRAQVVDHDMNLVGPAAWIQNTAQNTGWPATDGDGFRFLVAWEQQEALNPAATDVRGRIVTVGSAGITTLGGDLDLVTYPGDLDIAPDVALLGDKFGLVFTGQNPNSPFHDDCYFKAIAADGSTIGDELRLDVTPGTDYAYEHAPRLIGQRDGDPGTGSDDGLVVFADQSLSTADSDVGLQAVAAMGAGGAVVDRGGGCGPGGLAVGSGPFALGNTQFRCELFGAQPLAIPFLLYALPAPPQSCGSCTYVQPLSALFVANTAGHAAATLVLPGNPGFVGTTIDFQFVSFNVAYVGCPGGPGVAASNIVRAALDY